MKRLVQIAREMNIKTSVISGYLKQMGVKALNPNFKVDIPLEEIIQQMHFEKQNKQNDSDDKISINKRNQTKNVEKFQDVKDFFARPSFKESDFEEFEKYIKDKYNDKDDLKGAMNLINLELARIIIGINEVAPKTSENPITENSQIKSKTVKKKSTPLITTKKNKILEYEPVKTTNSKYINWTLQDIASDLKISTTFLLRILDKNGITKTGTDNLTFDDNTILNDFIISRQKAFDRKTHEEIELLTIMKSNLNKKPTINLKGVYNKIAKVGSMGKLIYNGMKK